MSRKWSNGGYTSWGGEVHKSGSLSATIHILRESYRNFPRHEKTPAARAELKRKIEAAREAHRQVYAAQGLPH